MRESWQEGKKSGGLRSLSNDLSRNTGERSHSFAQLLKKSVGTLRTFSEGGLVKFEGDEPVKVQSRPLARSPTGRRAGRSNENSLKVGEDETGRTR